MKPVRLLAGVAALIAVAALAPVDSRADSVFAQNFLGERVDIGDARIVALGGFVQTVDDSLAVLQYNPASLAWMKRFSFGAAGYFTSDKNKGADLTRRSNSTTFSQFLVAFPVYRQRITVGAGFRGRYDPDGEFVVPGETSEGDAFDDRYERSGGLFAVPIIVAVDAGNYAKVGFFYSLERGKIEELWAKDFASPAADATSDRERIFKGHCIGGGFVTRPVPRLSIGLTYESKIDYDVDVTETYTASTVDTAYSESASMPDRMTVSLAYRLSQSMTVFAGGSVCNFEDFTGLNFPPERLASEQVAALGIEYRVGDSRTPLRGSFRWEQLPYTMPSGEKVHKIAFALGTGKLMKRGRGKLDLALQFANTGSVDRNNYSDRSVSFFLSISGSEDWKRARDRRN